MDDLRIAPLVGIVGCLAVLLALAAPYVLVEDVAGVGLYYGSGAINPLLAGLFAAVALIALAAGREGRSDPALSAGVALVLGAVIAVIAVAWALTVRVDVVAIDTAHRWIVAGASVFVPAGSAWFARALGLL
ncbi:hypothetical protein BV210_15105 [Halorientalis sp. IM1011]|uniref:DUF7548 family protein n=1 Tax=Halorientalis sp. IM1011 TaxID=1932360 RepID=UPI00097CC1B3|nr:hypothetical protein [Halorientalis sp. IM1011]AQL43948.1 hypothetical protein BV210_15105 [Halorientalis sp. IM1011]